MKKTLPLLVAAFCGTSSMTPPGAVAQNAVDETAARNASRYGLYNLPSEPWHWSTNGN